MSARTCAATVAVPGSDHDHGPSGALPDVLLVLSGLANLPRSHRNTSSEAIYSILRLLLRPLAIADDYADATKLVALKG